MVLLVLAVLGRVLPGTAGEVGKDQGVELAGTADALETGGDLGDGSLICLVQRGPHDGADPVCRRWLDHLGSQVPQQLDPHLLVAALVVPDEVHQMGGELDRVGLAALVPAGQLPDLGPVPLGGARGEVVRAQLGRPYPGLSGDVLDRVPWQLGPHPGEPAPPGDELQLDREAQPGRPGFVPQPAHLIADQCEVLDHPVQPQIPPHPAPAPSRAVRQPGQSARRSLVQPNE
ncbi:hypothetical protein OG313_36730 [Streptomyces virginiae]|nr:hypothetical protein [Streptomyces virginiae]MCX5181022.1 hypothetical protein [Streptomyces virginiae]